MSYREPARVTVVKYEEEPEPRDWRAIAARAWLVLLGVALTAGFVWVSVLWWPFAMFMVGAAASVGAVLATFASVIYLDERKAERLRAQREAARAAELAAEFADEDDE